MIVTSSLFNEQPLDSKHVLQELKQVDNSQQSLVLRLLGVSILNVMISILIKTKFNSVSPLLFPCLLPAYITVCYFIYRHHVSFKSL